MAELNLNFPDRPKWVPDAQAPACNGCARPFTWLIRKHHCRACGNIFCGKCVEHYILLPVEKFGYTEPQKCCESCWIKWNGLDFSSKTSVLGDPNNPAIIFIHGSCLNRSIWKYQMESLSSRFYTIALDLPEHGSRHKERLTQDAANAAIEEAISSVPRQKAVLVGWGIGGIAALRYAAAHPDNVTGLFLGGCSMETYNDVSSDLLTGTLEVVFNVTPTPTLLDSLPNRYPEVPRAVWDETVFRTGFHNDVYHHCIRFMKESSKEYFVSLIKSFGGPIQMVNGENDFRVAEQKFLDACQHGKLYIVPRGSHLCFLENRNSLVVTDLIKEFASNVESQQQQSYANNMSAVM